jgi:hypothetical protein
MSLVAGLVLTAAMQAPPATAASLPPALSSAAAGIADWQRWGSGEMRWLGFELYRATLWVAAAPAEQTLDDAPHALVLHYRRAIKAGRLVQVSLDEMRSLGVSETDLRRWEADLLRVFRDVAEGDSITGVHRPGVGASFFHGATHTGDVEDPGFARAFFAIWLDPRTSAPRLREALLRQPLAPKSG